MMGVDVEIILSLTSLSSASVCEPSYLGDDIFADAHIGVVVALL